MAKKVRVMLVSSVEVSLQGITRILEPAVSIDIVAQATSVQMALERIQSTLIDVIYIDSQIVGSIKVFEAAKADSRRAPPYILAFGLDAPDSIDAMLDAGVTGYVLLAEPGKNHVQAIRAVARGETYFSQAVMHHILARTRRNATSAPPVTLSPREVETLPLLGQDMTDKQIAQTLNVAVSTARGYVQELRRKFGVNSRRGVVRRAQELGMLPPELTNRN